MVAEDKLESAVCVIEHMLEMEKYPSIFYKQDFENVLQALNEYKWYTKQDLVPRDDVIELHDSEDDYCNEKCMYYDKPEYCYMRCIPTARPPKEDE